MLTGLHETMSASGAFRLDDIISIGDPSIAKAGEIETRPVRFAGDRQCRLLEFEVAALMRRPVQLIPAEPGTYRIWGDICAEPIAWTAPVIAWALCVDGAIRVVTPNGVNDGCAEHDGGLYVQMPGGSIQGVGEWTEEAFFDDRNAYIDWLRCKWRKQQQAGDQADAGL